MRTSDNAFLYNLIFDHLQKIEKEDFIATLEALIERLLDDVNTEEEATIRDRDDSRVNVRYCDKKKDTLYLQVSDGVGDWRDSTFTLTEETARRLGQILLLDAYLMGQRKQKAKEEWIISQKNG